MLPLVLFPKVTRLGTVFCGINIKEALYLEKSAKKEQMGGILG